ncbi:MAG: LysR family transcriptional regulator [Nitrococcus sp.]|nr:LysR family transcriptional regulator [Nitrococcus sp.]
MPEQSTISLRISLKSNIRLGPGKADLLQGILETGSIAAAGRRMGMSYRRAWYHIYTLNHYFCEPVVIARTGGRSGGGADLTETGRVVLGSLRRMEAAMALVVADEVARLEKLAAPKLD